MNDVEIHSLAAAATSVALLESKNAVRSYSEGLSPERRELICKLMDDLFRLGFTEGVKYLGNQLLGEGHGKEKGSP